MRRHQRGPRGRSWIGLHRHSGPGCRRSQILLKKPHVSKVMLHDREQKLKMLELTPAEDHFD